MVEKRAADRRDLLLLLLKLQRPTWERHQVLPVGGTWKERADKEGRNHGSRQEPTRKRLVFWPLLQIKASPASCQAGSKITSTSYSGVPSRLSRCFGPCKAKGAVWLHCGLGSTTHTQLPVFATSIQLRKAAVTAHHHLNANPDYLVLPDVACRNPAKECQYAMGSAAFPRPTCMC